ncbi:DegT/DnrJ/EryC1/StrS family aminotransferase [Puniceicoccus vermicola]|uniref:DegT/DnrJ/EryC1/StrS family aminotransferase n=1 Tax=Puniceicoccus vermicola TaxID=388746 RepID=A0A7X1E6M7_9BACT|nr:DegT/DnrJ/EryC1/StrS family aminotransferase [Puniceicoccus vermicola]MBC2604281.1 DegT/DnrJ/EryC1/StrS family aminotransferase [Puniceicoccus vermicola]
MSIPLFDLTRQNDALMDELLATAERVLRSGRYIMGDEIDGLEAEAAQALGSVNSLAVSSGTDAILLALMAAGIGPGDEVILPDFTFFATGGCVARTGARPVFVDVCPYSYNLLPEAVEAAITEKTRAIIPVHLFGQSADMSRLMPIAQKHGLRVIEDCAQSIGAKHHGDYVGSIGDYGAISFFPTKNLGGFGDGGLVLASDPIDFGRAKIMRVHGMEPKYYHPETGGNFRMDAIQAALLRIKLPHLSSYNAGRQANAEYYLKTFGENPQVFSPTEDTATATQPEARLILPLTYSHNEVTWNQFTVRIPGEGARESFRNHLQEHEIGTEIYYPLPLSQQKCFERYSPDACPTAAMVADECVSLPIFPELTSDEREKVAEAVLSWLNQ